MCGGCHCHPHRTEEEANACGRQGLTQGHKSESPAELGCKPGLLHWARLPPIAEHYPKLENQAKGKEPVLPVWPQAHRHCFCRTRPHSACPSRALWGYVLSCRFGSRWKDNPKGYGFSALKDIKALDPAQQPSANILFSLPINTPSSKLPLNQLDLNESNKRLIRVYPVSV